MWPWLPIAIAKSERLTAGAGAPIGDAHLRLRAHQGGHELAALVLNFDQPGLECGAGGDGAAALDTQAPGRERGGLGLDPLL